MQEKTPDSLAVIAGRGVYPRLLAESAKKRGVRNLFAVAFRGETDRVIEKYADHVRWVALGRLKDTLDALQSSGSSRAVMAGQITPTHLFRLRMDRAMMMLLRRLPVRNAHTIFGAVAEELKKAGIDLIPASSFMEPHMPEAGVLTVRRPTEEEKADVETGMKAAHVLSELDIGQTVAVKRGTVIAAEAFEGTNAAIRRAGRLAGGGIVVVKKAKSGHDMRFDIPVAGTRTIRVLRKARASVLALEAGRSIILERDKVIAAADRAGICVTAGKGPE
ncbi:MAG: UDP-2,3-diacylglucosamine diphosphatase LpxI [Kiritimatiellia bacterium]